MIGRTEDQFDVYADPAPVETGEAATAAERVRPDPEAVASAEEALERAVLRLETAQGDQESAEDALVDAEGKVEVLVVKVDDYEADEKKLPWQRAAAREELAKARRTVGRTSRRFSRTEDRVVAAEAAVARAQTELEEARQTPAAVPDEEPVVLRFASLTLFVERFVLPNWVHWLGENRAGTWCRQWWEHPEAVTRLEAMWEAFEVMRLQPAPAFSTWLRDHFDPHMRMLTAPEGAFFRCESGEHKAIHELRPRWATVPPPTGMFAVDEDALVQPGAEDEADGSASSDVGGDEEGAEVKEESGE